MNIHFKKYNPGFLSDEEIVEAFCVRTSEFQSMIEMIRDCRGESNPHQIVIGVRGSGKTNLLLRIAAEIRLDESLHTHFYPVVFSEECYEISSVGEFWLECLSRLAVQISREKGQDNLQRSYEDLRNIVDDQTLADRCLASILDFADQENKRLVLFVENLNTLFSEMPDQDAGWQLRKILQTEPRVVLIASATCRFDQINNPDQALYELFRVISLPPLETSECKTLWKTVTGRNAPPTTLRPLQILTGGNLRLLMIVACAGRTLSFRDLLEDLLNLVDEHTEYFRSHLESLPPQERRVYLALADLWRPSTTKKVAKRARTTTSKCSAQLARLSKRALVEVAGGTARRKQYYLTERMYNIYYLLRRPTGPNRMIETLVRLMESVYSTEELTTISYDMVRQLPQLQGYKRVFYEKTLSQFLRIPALAQHRHELVSMLRKSIQGTSHQQGKVLEESIDLQSIPSSEHRHHTEAQGLYDKGCEHFNVGDLNAALSNFNAVIDRFKDSQESNLCLLVAQSFVMKSETLYCQNLPQECLNICEEIVQRYGNDNDTEFQKGVAWALANKAAVLLNMSQIQDSLATIDDLDRRFGDCTYLSTIKPVFGVLKQKILMFLNNSRPKEAVQLIDEIDCRFGQYKEVNLKILVATALLHKGEIQIELDKPKDAMDVFDTIVQRYGSSKNTELQQIVALAMHCKRTILLQLNDASGAIEALDTVIQRYGTNETAFFLEIVARSLIDKAWIFVMSNCQQEAISACDEAIRRLKKRQDFPNLVFLIADAHYVKGIAMLRSLQSMEAYSMFEKALEYASKIKTSYGFRLQSEAMVGKAQSLEIRGNFEEALASYDKVISKFSKDTNSRAGNSVKLSLAGKVPILDALGRHSDAVGVYKELARQFGSTVPSFQTLKDGFLINQTGHHFISGQFRKAVEMISHALENSPPATLEDRLQVRAFRAMALWETNDCKAVESDIKAILRSLHKLHLLPANLLESLMDLSVLIGYGRMREFIETSKSSNLLMAFTTALAQEEGQRPRVAREVEEVAKDMRKRLNHLKRRRERLVAEGRSRNQHITSTQKRNSS